MTAPRRAALKRIAQVHLRQSGAIAMLVCDGACAATWRGSMLGGPYDRMSIEGAGQQIRWDGGEGTLASLGQPVTVPILHVFRWGDDLLMAAIDWSPKASEVGALAPSSVTPVGTVVVHSGLLAVVSAPEAVEAPAPKHLEAARTKGIARFEWGLLVRCPTGAYEVQGESVQLGNGAQRRRVRIRAASG